MLAAVLTRTPSQKVKLMLLLLLLVVVFTNGSIPLTEAKNSQLMFKGVMSSFISHAARQSAVRSEARFPGDITHDSDSPKGLYPPTGPH